MAPSKNVLQPICNFLRSERVATLDKKDPNADVVVVHHHMTLDACLRALAQRHILSAPVLGTSNHDPQSTVKPECHADGDVLGFVDVRDILISFLDFIGDVDSMLKMRMLTRMQQLEAIGSKFCARTIKDVQNFGSDGNFIHSGNTKMSIWEIVFSSLLHPERRSVGNAPTSPIHHRVAFFNSKFQITQIVTQTDIVRHIYANKDQLQDCLNVKVMDVPGLCSKNLIQLKAHKSALEALTIMKAYNVSAVPIVTGSGVLIGTFSMSEMRSIMAEHFGALALPVAEFLALNHGTEFQDYHEEIMAELETVKGSKAATFAQDAGRSRRRAPGEQTGQQLAYLTEDGTLLELLELVLHHKVHRAYVVDSDNKPVAIATLTDVLHAIAGETPAGRPIVPI